jgi:uncharacterized protein with PIN domain
MAPEPSFLCDQMLGSLARWLRFLGYDTLYPEAMDDTSILKLARDGGRILLTRDKELASRTKGSGHLVRSDVLDEQLADIQKSFGLDLSGEKLLSRCSLCNAVLVGIDKVEAEKAGVPAPILSRHDRFWRCPGCGQLYWPGSHYERIMGKIGELDKGSGQ